MKVVALFSGAGGLDLGFKKAGCEIVWANDSEERFIKTYEKNIGPHAITKDVKKVDVESIPDCDIVIGGFPCLGYTIAKVGRAVDDEQNYLYKEYIRVLNAKNPPYFLVENVPGIKEGDKFKEKFKEMLVEFESAGDVGYYVNPTTLNAVNYGVPQSRERVIIYGVRKNLDKKLNPPEPTHGEQPIVTLDNRRLFQWITIKEAIGDLPEDTSQKINISNHEGTNHKVKITGYIGNRVLSWNKTSPTITGRGSMTGGPVIHPHPNLKRRLTVRECARLQSFPDDFIFEGGKTSAKYAQIGNAVPPLFSFRIAQQIMKDVGEKPNIFNPDEWKLPWAEKIPKN